MGRNDDSDIKIFTPSKKAGDGIELVELVEMMEKQRSNGNTEKAVELGKNLAALTSVAFEDVFVGTGLTARELSNASLYQLRALMVFSAQYSLCRFLEQAVLSTEAVNSLYNEIRKLSEGFYANVTDGSSFTFYFLAVRRKREVEKQIGDSFAMLCDKEKDARYAVLGTNTFNVVQKLVFESIEKAQFEI